MRSSPGIVAVTGASGLLGRHLCDHFRKREWRVRALMRAAHEYPFAEPHIEPFRLELPDAIDPASIRGAHVVVHAAYATRSPAGEARRVNEDGTLALLEAARAAGVARFVFVSSFSAHSGAVSYYGRSKLTMEGHMDPERDLVVRPGLVLAHDGGLAQRLRRTIARTRVAPVFDGGMQRVQTIHIDDLCAAFSRAIEQDFTGTLNVAEPDGLSMRELLLALGRSAGVRPLLVPLPAAPTVRALRAVETIGFTPPVSSDNLLGLITMRHVDTRADLLRLGVRVRAAGESIRDLAISYGTRPPTMRGGAVFAQR